MASQSSYCTHHMSLVFNFAVTMAIQMVSVVALSTAFIYKNGPLSGNASILKAVFLLIKAIFHQFKGYFPKRSVPKKQCNDVISFSENYN